MYKIFPHLYFSSANWEVIILIIVLFSLFPFSSDDHSQKKPIYRTSAESLFSTSADKQPLV